MSDYERELGHETDTHDILADAAAVPSLQSRYTHRPIDPTTLPETARCLARTEKTRLADVIDWAQVGRHTDDYDLKDLADLIIRAVNSHELLLATCEAILAANQIDWEPHHADAEVDAAYGKAFTLARAAIMKAKGSVQP